MVPLARQELDENRFRHAVHAKDGRHHLGDMVQCGHCDALMFVGEQLKRSTATGLPVFGLCCNGGKITNVPKIEPDPVLLGLLLGPDHQHFLHYIRQYNSDLSFTSVGGLTRDKSFDKSRGPYLY